MIKLSSHNRYLIILNIKSYQIINILIKSGIYKWEKNNSRTKCKIIFKAENKWKNRII